MEPASALTSMHVSCMKGVLYLDMALQSIAMLMGPTTNRLNNALLGSVNMELTSMGWRFSEVSITATRTKHPLDHLEVAGSHSPP